jgi:Domain of unknown function (DUF4169)
MAAEIINLRRVRKAKARADKQVQAASNRIAFGRTKAEKLQAEAEERLAARRLDGAKRDSDKT